MQRGRQEAFWRFVPGAGGGGGRSYVLSRFSEFIFCRPKP